MSTVVVRSTPYGARRSDSGDYGTSPSFPADLVAYPMGLPIAWLAEVILRNLVHAMFLI